MKRTRLKNYLRDRRGVAAVEFAFGTAVMVSASLLALDLYRLAGTQTTVTHVAVSLADTVSREEPEAPHDPGGLTPTQLRQTMDDFVESLSELLHEEQFPTSNANFVVAAVYKDPGNTALTALWRKEAVVLPDATSPLTSCASANQTNEIEIHTNSITLPAGFSMADHEIVIVAEVCVERTNTFFPGPAYAHYIVPSRDDNLATRLSAP